MQERVSKKMGDKKIIGQNVGRDSFQSD